MLRYVLVTAFLAVLAVPAAHAWLPDDPLAEPQYEEILTLENSRDTGERLRALARDANPRVRARALRALARAQEPALAETFGQALADPDAAVRDEAALGLGLLWSRGDDTRLLAAFETETDPRVRATIVEAIGRTASVERGIPFLSTLAAGSDTSLSFRACIGIGVAASRVDGKVDVTGGTPGLSQAIRSPHAATRWAAAWAFLRGRPEDGARYLRPLLSDKAPLVRMNAVRALAASKREALAQPISELIRDPDWRVRLEAIKAMAPLKGTRFVSVMALGLEDPAELVQLATIEAMGALGWQSGLTYLEPIIRESDDWRRRSAAIIAKTRIEGDGALPLLEQLKSSREWQIRRAVAEAFGIVRSDQARSMLGSMTVDENPQVLAAVAASLANYPQIAALEDLRKLLKSGDMAVITSAASALGQRADRTAVADLVAAWGTLRAPSDVEPMVEILAALGNIAVPPDTATVHGALSDADRVALMATLEAGLKDGELNVARAAADALERIDGRDRRGEIAAAGSVPFPLSLDAIKERKGGRVGIVLARGTLVIELLPGAAPNTVANFVGLASRGYYNNLTFHRVVPGFVTQDGCPRGDGWGGPGYAIRCEYNDLHYDAGMVGMALSGKDTGGSQYFITQTPQPHLDGRYTIFGRVVSGMELLEDILVGEPITRVDVLPS